MRTGKARLLGVTLRFASALVCLMVLVGCATTGLKQFHDPMDSCNASRQPLIDTGNELKNWTIGSTAIGAAIGAAAGGILAAVFGGNTAEIAGATAAGAVVGGAGGYLTARRKEAKTQAELIAAIDGDASSDSQKAREVTTAIERLGTCRQKQIETVRVRFKNGDLSKAMALSQANELQTAIDKDNELIELVLGRVAGRFETYVDAQAEVLKVDRGTVEPVKAQKVAGGVPEEPLKALALETQNAQGEQEKQKTRTERDIEALKRLLS